MRKAVRFLAATTLAFSSLFLASPAYASDWQTTSGLISGDSVQFNWQGGSASLTAEIAEGANLQVNNTIANRIGWGEPLPDTWTVSVNGTVYSGNAVELVSIPLPAGSVEITVYGIDRGFWAGWYGPIFTLTAPVAPPTPEITPEPSQPVSEEVARTEEVVRPEPTPEPTPEPVPAPPAPQPAPEPTPEPTSEPTPTETPQPTPEPTEEPEKVITPTPEPEPVVEPSSEPILPETPISEPESKEELMAVLAEEAKADDPVVPQELASIPLLGDAAVAVLEAFNAIGNLGADLTPEVREQAQETIVASVIVSNIASTSVMASSASYRRMK